MSLQSRTRWYEHDTRVQYTSIVVFAALWPCPLAPGPNVFLFFIYRSFADSGIHAVVSSSLLLYSIVFFFSYVRLCRIIRHTTDPRGDTHTHTHTHKPSAEEAYSSPNTRFQFATSPQRYAHLSTRCIHMLVGELIYKPFSFLFFHYYIIINLRRIKSIHVFRYAFFMSCSRLSSAIFQCDLLFCICTTTGGGSCGSRDRSIHCTRSLFR